MAYPDAMVTVRVVGEDGQPIEGAEVGMGFEMPLMGELGTRSVPHVGLSNAAGIFAASAETTGYVSYGATKKGYYRTVGAPYRSWKHSLGRWQPWNPTIEVVLKKIVNPIPMYARSVTIDLPELNKAIGYDLIAADWVRPYGGGSVPDFIFHATKRVTDKHDYEAQLTISFSHLEDGLQPIAAPPLHGSELRLPREAPAEGYQPQWVISKGRGPNRPIFGEAREDQNFVCRVRSERKDGGEVKALHGKIHGDIEFYPVTHATARLRFSYYLNPDGTRNLEFDPKRNLFKNLKPGEEVRDP